jgi:phosphate starvation-inducible protein PhoH and related proteins
VSRKGCGGAALKLSDAINQQYETIRSPDSPHHNPLKSPTIELLLDPIDNLSLAALCGPLDAHLRRLEAGFSVKISRRMAKFSISGSPARSLACRKALERFRYLASNGSRELSDEDIELTIAELRFGLSDAVAADVKTDVSAELGISTSANDADVASVSAPSVVIAADAAVDFAALESAASAIPLKVKRTDLMARTPMQLEYLKSIQQYDITFGIGPAGTGKTYLAVACAVDAFERDLIKRIVLVRPAVEAGERLGFLPGDLIQKVDPYLRPLYDALFDLMGFEKTTKLMERGTIEVAPLAFMRGRTLNGAFIILDEAQNTTPEQMKMFLTRIGFGTKTVVTGDPTQMDLQKNQKSGLIDAQRVLAGVPGIALTRFTSVDVVRHPLVKKIVNAYERHTPPDRSR